MTLRLSPEFFESEMDINQLANYLVPDEETNRNEKLKPVKLGNIPTDSNGQIPAVIFPPIYRGHTQFRQQTPTTPLLENNPLTPEQNRQKASSSPTPNASPSSTTSTDSSLPHPSPTSE